MLYYYFFLTRNPVGADDDDEESCAEGSWVPLSHIMKFSTLKKLCNSIQEMVSHLENAPTEYQLELDENKQLVREKERPNEYEQDEGGDYTYDMCQQQASEEQTYHTYNEEDTSACSNEEWWLDKQDDDMWE